MAIVGLFYGSDTGNTENIAKMIQKQLGSDIVDIRDIIEPHGAIIVGNWSTEGYTFESSRALLDDDTFVGLCIDEDRQPELTAARVETWVKQVYDEMCLSELA